VKIAKIYSCNKVCEVIDYNAIRSGGLQPAGSGFCNNNLLYLVSVGGDREILQSCSVTETCLNSSEGRRWLFSAPVRLASALL
jgi:hypothetical protein